MISFRFAAQGWLKGGENVLFDGDRAQEGSLPVRHDPDAAGAFMNGPPFQGDPGFPPVAVDAAGEAPEARFGPESGSAAQGEPDPVQVGMDTPAAGNVFQYGKQRILLENAARRRGCHAVHIRLRGDGIWDCRSTVRR